MAAFFEVLKIVSYSAVRAFDIVLLIYCVSTWFIRDPFNKFMMVLHTIVDPVLVPIRALLHKISFFREFPIDFSAFITFILCEIIMSMLI